MQPAAELAAQRGARVEVQRAGDARRQRGDVGGVLGGRPLAHADRHRQRLGDADRLGPLGDQVALGDLARQQHAIAAPPLGGVEGAIGLLDERVEAGARASAA